MTLLLIGESDVGKTHYGGQLLIRLRHQQGAMRMNGAPTNINAFEEVVRSLNSGRASDHTSSGIYRESVWPVVDGGGNALDLVWPDYAGEQVKDISVKRRVSEDWRQRIVESAGWILMVRPQHLDPKEDIFSRPLAEIGKSRGSGGDFRVSDQARLIELLQILCYVRGVGPLRRVGTPALTVLLSCWDEVGGTAMPPEDLLSERMPLLHQFVTENWRERARAVFGLSSLGRPLKKDSEDPEFLERGPRQFGFVVLPDGRHNPDLTLPITDLSLRIR